MDQIGRLITLNATRDPNRLAITTLDGQSITYGRLDERTTRLANALIAVGLRSGDRLGVWLEDRIEYIEVYFAAAKAGLVVVPINERFRAKEAIYQLHRTEAAALVFSSRVMAAVDEVLQAHEIGHLIAVGDEAKGVQRSIGYEAILEKGAPTLPPLPDDNAPFSICFTSGTTGFPKGATLTHRSLKNVARTQAVALRLALGSVNLQLASMSFPATFGSHILSHVFVGGTTVLVGQWGGDAEQLVRVIEHERINHFYLPSPLLRDFTAICAQDPKRWSSLQSVLHAGSRAEPHLLENLARVIGGRFVEGWGMSEISGGLATAVSARDLSGISDAANLFASVGRPVPETAVKIVDESRQPLPHDGATIGELAVHSSSLMQGYWGDNEATARAVVDGWYYTGDLGRMDPAGFVYIVDRRSDLIVSGGMNVYPAELELVIHRMPGVAECAVVAGPHERWGQTPVAYVVRSGNSKITGREIIDSFAAQMASYKKPTRVVFIEALPRHPTSKKILRTVLRDLAASSSS
jgi:fatty-acyl-CoA synthase